ncbi:MAG: protein jag [Clostridia bacterium]|nr:protein jag [Clostridia bacterium]
MEEAVELALTELGIEKENAEIEVIQEPAKGFLGIGAKDAVVKVTAKKAEKPAKAEKTAKAKKPEKAEKAPAKPKKNKTTGGVYNSESPAENAKNFITDVLNAMGIEVTVTAELKEDIIEVNLEGDNMGVVIGKRGDTLDSLQYLTSLVVNQKSEDYIKVSIDTENYRQKREEVLCALANRLAAKVARTGKKFALEPMNPYERRIIHSNLQDNEDVTTFSIGQEPYRKVVIAPKNPKPYNKRGGYKKSEIKPADKSYPADADTEETSSSSVTYKADFKPQQHKAEYKNFEEYLAAHSKD